jgi:hypothetical protein
VRESAPGIAKGDVVDLEVKGRCSEDDFVIEKLRSNQYTKYRIRIADRHSQQARSDLRYPGLRTMQSVFDPPRKVIEFPLSNRSPVEAELVPRTRDQELHAPVSSG